MKKKLFAGIIAVVILMGTFVGFAQTGLFFASQKTEGEASQETYDPEDGIQTVSDGNENDIDALIEAKEKLYGTDISSAYDKRNISEESVNTQTGTLTLNQVDYKIPLTNGDFEIRRIFDSNLASPDFKYHSGPNKVSSVDPFYSKTYHIGLGWRFSFPMLELTEDGQGNGQLVNQGLSIKNIMYHTESGEVYSITPTMNGYAPGSPIIIQDVSDTTFVIGNHGLKDIEIKYISAHTVSYEPEGDIPALDIIEITDKKRGVTYRFGRGGHIAEINYSCGDRILFYYSNSSNSSDSNSNRINPIYFGTENYNQKYLDNLQKEYYISEIEIFSEGREMNVKFEYDDGLVSKVELPNGKIMTYNYGNSIVGNIGYARPLISVCDTNANDNRISGKTKYKFNTSSHSVERTYGNTSGTTNMVTIDDILYCRENRISHYCYKEITDNNSWQYMNVISHQDYECTKDGTKQVFECNVKKIGSETKYSYLAGDELNNSGDLYTETFDLSNGFWDTDLVATNDTCGTFVFQQDCMYSWRRMHSEILSAETYTDFTLDTTIVFTNDVITQYNSAGVIFGVTEYYPGNNNFTGYYARISPDNLDENDMNANSVALFKMKADPSNPAANQKETELKRIKFEDADLGPVCELNRAYHMRVEKNGSNIKIYVIDMTNPVIDFTDPDDNYYGASGRVGLRTFQRRATYTSFKIAKGNYTNTSTITQTADDDNKIAVTEEVHDYDGNLLRKTDVYYYGKIDSDFINYAVETTYEYGKYKLPKSVTTCEYKYIGGSRVKMNETREEYTYDEFGNLIEYRSPLAALRGSAIEEEKNSQEPEVITYKYDSRWLLPTEKLQVMNDSTTVKTVYSLTYDGTKIASEDIYENEDVIKSTTYTYDEYGRMTSKKEKGATDERTISYYYTETKNGSFSVTTNYGTDLSKIVKIDSVNGNVLEEHFSGANSKTKYEYDPLERLQSINYYDGEDFKERISYKYNDIEFQGQDTVSTTVTDGRGNSVTTEYDAYGRSVLRSIYDNHTNESIVTEKYTYDVWGNLETSADGNGNITTYSYNAAKRPIKKTVGDYVLNYEYSYKYGENKLGNFTATALYGEKGVDGSETIVYDAKNREINRTDGEGNTTETEYDYMGNVVSVTDGNGNKTTFEYDVLGRLLKSVKPNGDMTEYTYNVFDNVATKSEGDTVEEYTYNSAGLLTNEQQHLSGEDSGYYASYVYDNSGNVTEREKGTYTGSKRILSEKAKYSYDGRNRITQMSTYIDDNNCLVTTYSYDPCGNTIRKIMEKNGVTITADYEYDYANRMLSEICKLGDAVFSKIEYVYDKCGNPTEKKTYLSNDKSLSEYYTYYENNKLKTFTATNGLLTEYTYNNRGDIVKQCYIIDGEEKAPINYKYDVAGRLIFESDFSGNTISYSYDGADNLTKVVDPRYKDNKKSYIMYEYDACNRRIKTVLYENSSSVVAEEITYDAKGNIVNSKSGNVSESYKYDALNNVIAVIDGNGNESISTYDGSGRVISLTDANGNTTSTTYFGDGSIESITYPDGKKINYSISDYGFTKSVIKDRKGNSTTSTLNALGLPLVITYPDKTTESYEYDFLGRKTKYINKEGTIAEYSYDASGNLIEAIVYAAEDSNKATRHNKYVYTIDNMLEREIHYLEQDNEDGAYIIEYSYDDYGRVISQSDNGGALTEFYYDPAGNLAEQRVFYSDTECDSTTFSYDVRNNIAQQTVSGKTRTYRYNEKGLCTSVTDFDGTTTTYAYDNSGNVKSVVNPSKNEAYTYDGNGNLKSVEQMHEGSMVVVSEFAYDALNNLIESKDAYGNTTSYSYDENGNITLQITPEQQQSKKGTAYTYDDMNRCLSVTLPNGDIKEKYTYDAMGRIVAVSKGGSNVNCEYTYDIFGNVTDYKDYSGNNTHYEYNAQDNLLLGTDARGNTTKYTYYVNGLPKKVSYPDGGEISYTYDKKGRVNEQSVKQSTSARSVTKYVYNAIDKPVEITDPEGAVTKYTYDGCGNVLTYTDGVGNVNKYTYNGGLLKVASEYGVTHTYEYDEQGRLSGEYVGDRYTGYTYDVNGKLIRIAQADGGETIYDYNKDGKLKAEGVLRSGSAYDEATYSYDENGRVSEISYNTEPFSKITYEYDNYGRVASETNNSITTAYEYDSMDRLVKRTQNDGGVLKYWYDANGNVVCEKDARGNYVFYGYDEMNRLLSQSDSIVCSAIGNVKDSTVEDFVKNSYADAAKSMTYYYDLAGNLMVETNAAGASNKYTYDLNNRVLTVTTPDGVIASTKTYDNNGNVLTDKDANGNSIKYTYVNNRLETVTDRKGILSAEYSYNDCGETASVADALGNTTTYTYDQCGRLASVDMGLGVTVDYIYDAAGNLLEQTDGEGHSTVYTYYPYGMTASVTDADGNTESYEYDAYGNISFKTDGNGQTVQYSYNDKNLLTEISTNDILIEYSYDLNGNRTAMHDESGAYAYKYDARNRLVSVTKDKAPYLSYEYDLVGNLHKLSASGSTHSVYEYDSCNRVISVNDIQYGYDPNGNLVSRVTPVGEITYSYDENNRVTNMVNKLKGVVLSQYTYTYYANGYEKSKTDLNSATEYEYDACGRLSKVTSDGRTAYYTYDNAGNRIMSTESYDAEVKTEALGESSVSFDKKETHYTYTAANMLTSSTQIFLNDGDETGRHIVRCTFDNAGNQISSASEFILPQTGEENIAVTADNAGNYDESIEITVNKYNALNQLVGLSHISNGEKTSAQYMYNGDGLRISKTMNSDSANGSYYEYVYSGTTLIGMTDEAVTSLAAMYIGAYGCEEVKYNSGGEYNFTNAHGDVTNTVGKDGTVLNTFDYDEFGNLTECEENTASYIFMAHFRYAGEYYDIETGDYYLKSRYYNTSTGRFTQADTFLGYNDNPLSLNRYTYCYNNPIMFVDPSGHITVDAAGCRFEIDDDMYEKNWMEINCALLNFSDGGMTAEDFINQLQGIGVSITNEFMVSVTNEFIYELSISPVTEHRKDAENYLKNADPVWQNQFIEYYVGDRKIGSGNSNYYQMLYAAPQAPAETNRHGEEGTGVSMYNDYEFTVFDALNWLILTGGNINFALQVRITTDTGEEIAGQYKILDAFTWAYYSLKKYKPDEISKPMFYLGSTETDAMVAFEVYDAIMGRETDYGDYKVKDTEMIAGIYFGNESPSVLDKESMREAAKTLHDDGKGILWVPYLKIKDDFTVDITGIQNALNIKDSGNNNFFDVVIIQPGVFYMDTWSDLEYTGADGEKHPVGIKDAIGNRFNAVANIISDAPEGVKVGFELEFDMGLVTGRAQHNDDYSTYEPGMTAENKREAFLMYLKQLHQIEQLEQKLNIDIPIAIYSGGPNEQGFINPKANNNGHNIGNHAPNISSGTTREDVRERYNGKRYSDSDWNEYKGNLIYDISSVIFSSSGNKYEQINSILNSIWQKLEIN